MFDGAFEVRFPAGRIAEEFRNDLLPAERRERQRRDKLPRAASHHHLHAEPVLLQTAHEFRGFVSRHSAGHTKRDSHCCLSRPATSAAYSRPYPCPSMTAPAIPTPTS